MFIRILFPQKLMETEMSNDRSLVKSPGRFHVAELAQRTGTTPATIRYYVRKGLLEPERDPRNGYRCFSTADLHRLVFIRQAKFLGLTIKDIRTILKAIDDGQVPHHEVKSLVQRNLENIRGRIAELQAVEARISAAVELWRRMGEPHPDDDELCPLIERVVVTNGVSRVLHRDEIRE